MNAHTEIAKQISISDIIQEYDEKVAGIDDLIDEYTSFYKRLDVSSTISSAYVGRVYDHHPSIHKSTIETNLLKSAWKHVYNGLGISTIVSAKDRKSFEQALEKPPEFSLENIGATFGDYLINSRFHKLRGLVECFNNLDPFYKSHSKIKIGVAGMPKRIIINRVVGCWGTQGYGATEMKDVIDSLNVIQGDPHISHNEFHDFIEKAYKEKRAEYKGLTLKTFANGNGHLFFSKHKLVQINDALAEFYGDVLPDTPDEPVKRKASTEVSKDLQFYPTPDAVTEYILDREVYHRSDGEPMKVFEPSCGNGCTMDLILKKIPNAEMIGVEFDQSRAQLASDRGHRVIPANFLEVVEKPVFDLVFMNPPFYGLHWRKHLDHAIKFMKPDHAGQLICILPASAHVDGHLNDLKGQWVDLPIASFKESGTNISTGYFVMRSSRV